METRIPEQELSRFGEFVAQTMGLHFHESRRADLERGVAAAAGELGFEDSAACVRWLMSAPLTRSQLELLASNLTIGETYFFREDKSFNFLAGQILPALMHNRQRGERRLRIWSAGCSTGEEPYSIAILLRRVIADIEDWDVTLLATDINPQFLHKAEQGVFGAWSFRSTPSWVKERYFQATADGQLKILPEIQRMVRFDYLNLAEDAYPSLTNNTNAMDVIFCRNVLMYFTAEHAEKVIQKLHRAQVEGGWLIVSPSESIRVLSSPYHTVNVDGAIAHRKDGAAPQRAASRAPAMAPAPLPSEAPPDTAKFEDLLARAAELYEQGRYAETVITLDASQLKNSLTPGAYSLLARALVNQGKMTDALRCCDRWIAADKLDPSAHYLRAVILQEQRAMDEAVGSLRTALYLDPNFALAHLALGNIARYRNQDRQAHKHFENTLNLLRRHPPDGILPESEGITAGQLTRITSSLLNLRTVA
ncbi:MAG: methyltransferase, CheR-type [Phycisphaerales bacterium]|nr:methyltransferase, CheR-type [Phycisphaerales bacterium]